MPIKKDNYTTVPVALEPPIYEVLKECVHRSGLARLKLLRMIVKFVLSRPDLLKQVIAAGDPPV